MTDFWVPHEIESCNFQNLLVFRFPETSQNLISFRQLLFSLFHYLKKSKKNRNLPKLPRLVTKMIWSFYFQSQFSTLKPIWIFLFSKYNNFLWISMLIFWPKIFLILCSFAGNWTTHAYYHRPHIAQVQRTLEYLVPHCRTRKSESDAGYVPVDSLKDNTPN